MAELYTPKRAADLLGVSPSALRLYTDRYAVHLSTEATSTPRKFTRDDLKVFAFVAHSTGLGRTHDEILATWDEEFPRFVWEVPAPATDESTALISIAELGYMRAQLEEAQRNAQAAWEREHAARQEARQEAEQLREEINRLHRELGKAEGELSALRRLAQDAPQATRGPWWARLFGGK